MILTPWRLSPAASWARASASAWIPVGRLVDHDRLLAYADALVARQGLPEDMAGFIQREAALTAAEAAFQAQTLSQPGLIARGGNSPDVE